MSKTTTPTTPTVTRPGPRAYVSLILLVLAAVALAAFKITQVALGLSFGRGVNTLTLVVALLCALGAGGQGCWVIDRRRRSDIWAVQRQHQADTWAIQHEHQADITGLREQVADIENRAWWTEPATEPTEPEVTVDLGQVGGNVIPIRRLSSQRVKGSAG